MTNRQVLDAEFETPRRIKRVEERQAKLESLRDKLEAGCFFFELFDGLKKLIEEAQQERFELLRAP